MNEREMKYFLLIGGMNRRSGRFRFSSSKSRTDPASRRKKFSWNSSCSFENQPMSLAREILSHLIG